MALLHLWVMVFMFVTYCFVIKWMKHAPFKLWMKPPPPDEKIKNKLNYLKEKGDLDWTSTFFYLKLQLKHASFFLHFEPIIRFEIELVGNNNFDVILIGSDDGEHVL